MMRSSLLFLAMVSIVFWCGCDSTKDLVEEEMEKTWSKEKMSRGMFFTILDNPSVYPLLDQYEYSVVYGYLTRIHSKLVKSQPIASNSNVWLVESEEHLAWMLPDGTSFFTTSWLLSLDHDDQVATTMALLEANRRKDLSWNQMIEKSEPQKLDQCESKERSCDQELLFHYIYSSCSEEDLVAVTQTAEQILCESDFNRAFDALFDRLPPASEFERIYGNTYSAVDLQNCNTTTRSNRYPYMIKEFSAEGYLYENMTPEGEPSNPQKVRSHHQLKPAD